MGRIRSTHPDQWTDEAFVSCSPLARLFGLALRNIADDNGIFPWKPMQLRWQLLPNDNVDANELLCELLDTNQVMRFDADDGTFGMIRNFARFQSPQRPSFKYPTPTESSLTIGYKFHDMYRNDPIHVPESAHNPNAGKGKGKGKGVGKGKDTIAPSTSGSTPDNSPVVMEFPCAGKPATWQLRQSKLDEWRESYGQQCNVEAELHKARQWLRDNKPKRKTASGMTRFLSSWLKRSIDSGRASPPERCDSGNVIDWGAAIR